MRTDHWYDSCGKGKLHYCKWTPESEIKGILQIVHGIAEFVEWGGFFPSDPGYVTPVPW